MKRDLGGSAKWPATLTFSRPRLRAVLLRVTPPDGGIRLASKTGYTGPYDAFTKSAKGTTSTLCISA